MRNVLRRSRASNCGASTAPRCDGAPPTRAGGFPADGRAATDEPLSPTDGAAGALSPVEPRVGGLPGAAGVAWPLVRPAPVPDTMDADVAAKSNTMVPVGDPGNGRTPVCVTSRPVVVNPPAIG